MIYRLSTLVLLLGLAAACDQPSSGPDGRCHVQHPYSDVDCPCVDEAHVVPAGKTGGTRCHPLAVMTVESMASAGVTHERTAAKPDLGHP